MASGIKSERREAQEVELVTVGPGGEVAKRRVMLAPFEVHHVLLSASCEGREESRDG